MAESRFNNLMSRSHSFIINSVSYIYSLFQPLSFVERQQLNEGWLLWYSFPDQFNLNSVWYRNNSL